MAVVETETAYFVTEAADSDDWLVRFEKSDGFPADAWATSMVDVFNARHERRPRLPLLGPEKVRRSPSARGRVATGDGPATGVTLPRSLRVAVLGTGRMGAALAAEYARAGHDVRVTSSARMPR